MDNFLKRVAASSCLVPLLLLCLYSARSPWEPLFLVALLSALLAATWELLQLIDRTGERPQNWLVLSTATAYITALFLAHKLPSWAIAPQIVLFAFLALLFASLLYGGTTPISVSGASLLPVAYLVIPLGTLLSITYFFPPNTTQDGRWWTLFLIISVKGNDVAAYFAGKTIGKRRLAPYISPKKTWEGAAAGVAAGALLGLCTPSVIQSLDSPQAFELPALLSSLLGASLAIVAQFSDLSESLIKRNAKTKDSSSLPGLGGALDIVDSLIFTSPFLYLFLNLYYR